MGNFLKTVKGKIIIAAAALAIILIAVLMFSAFNAEKGYRSISVSEIVGNVMTENNGKKYEAYKNMRLEGGYALTTDSDSYTRMILDDDKYVKLEQLSRAVFEDLGNKNRRRTSIRLENGVLTNELVSPLRDDESYVINTPNAVLAVRGTFFKVEVRYDESGEAFTDVYTYGGTVACKRVMPDGTVVDEDVLINSGYKACIKMDEIITVYVEEVIEYAEGETENDDGVKEEIHDNVDPIELSDISDSDLVDIYNASKNGHKMFIDTADFWNEIVARGIDLSEYHSAYDGGEIAPYDDTYIPDTQETSGEQGEEPASGIDNDAQSAEESSDDSDEEILSDEDEAEEDSEAAENDENTVSDMEDSNDDGEDNGGTGVGSYAPQNNGASTDDGSGQNTADEGEQNDKSDVNDENDSEDEENGSEDEENDSEDEENDSEEDDNSDEAADSSTEDRESDKDNSGKTAAVIPYYGGNINTGGNTNTAEDTDKDTDTDNDEDTDKDEETDTDKDEEIGGIEINDTNFPDDVFRNYISASFDSDSNGYLSDSEIEAATRINVSGTVSEDGNITSLQGTEHFKYLRALNCRYNSGLASLDLSGNADLYNLDVSFTGIESIDLSGNTALGYLYCNDTDMTSLDIRTNTALVYLYCSNIGISSLDVGSNTALTDLNCDNCGLAYVDLSNNPGITTFSASGNKYSVTVTDGNFDTNTIAGFDIKKVSELKGAEIGEDGVLTEIKEGTAEITYTYDCGSGKSAVFTLVPDAISTFAPEFDGTIYLDNGSVTITETGFTQGDSAEETPYTGDYTITQKDSGTAAEASVTVVSGKHNITMDGVNISSENDAFTVGKKADLIISGGENTNIISGLKNVIYNDGKIALSSGKFHLSANSADNTVETAAIYNNGTLKINGNTEINAETTENDGNASGFINNSSFVIEDDPKITIFCQSCGNKTKNSDSNNDIDGFSDAIKNKNGTFTVNGGTFDLSVNCKNSAAIDNYSNFIFNDGSAVISAFDALGIYTFWNEGNFTVNGGTLNFKCDSSRSGGFGCGKNSIFTLNGGIVNATSSTLSAHGMLLTDCEFVVNGGKLNVNSERWGIYFRKSTSNKFLITGGIVEISGDETDLEGNTDFCIDGGSLRFSREQTYNFPFPNSHGDELECVVYDTFPDERERTFENSDGSSYVYKLEETDAASDGKYYVWTPKFNGTIYLDNGSVTITETGFTQGDSAEETPYTGDYTITQKDSSTPAEASITVVSGKHNITMDSVNIGFIEGVNLSVFEVQDNAEVVLTGIGTNKFTARLTPVRALWKNNGNFTVTDGEFIFNETGSGSGIFNDSTGYFKIEDGHYDISYYSRIGIANAGKFEIAGGSIDIRASSSYGDNDIKSSDSQFIITGGSLHAEGNAINAVMTNAAGEELECAVYDSIPDKSELTFECFDGSKYTYNIRSEDSSSDGKYYIWKPKSSEFSGMIYMDNGSVTITETGFTQGDATEETPYTGDYTITQLDTETALDNSIIVTSGIHNIKISDLNISSLIVGIYDNETVVNLEGSGNFNGGDKNSSLYVLNKNAVLNLESGHITVTNSSEAGVLNIGNININSGVLDISVDNANGLSNSGTFKVNGGRLFAGSASNDGILNSGILELASGSVAAYNDDGMLKGGLNNIGTFRMSGGKLISEGVIGVSSEGTMEITGGKADIRGMDGVSLLLGSLSDNSIGKLTVSGGCVEISDSAYLYGDNSEFIVIGGSVKISSEQRDGVLVLTNTQGDELECVVYDTFPDESARTFENSDSSSYVYALEETDAASDGKYYVWKPKFDGTIYMDNGYVTITETGFTQGDAAEETPYTGDYTFTQKDSSTAISEDISIKGGDHNITFKDVNVDSESIFTLRDGSVKVVGEGTNKLGGIRNLGTLEICSGTFELTADREPIENESSCSFIISGGNITANGIKSSGIYNDGNFEIKGGTVTAHLDDALGRIDGGVYNEGTFLVSGGELRAISERDCGLINNGTMKITGGKVYVSSVEGNNSLFIGTSDSVGKFEVLGGSVEVYPDIVIASGEAVITGGSFKTDDISSGIITNSYGDELECVTYDTFPDESARTFKNSDGSSYVYALEKEDAAFDGKYYVWKPKFDGTIYMDNGSVTITETGFTQGDASEEISYTGDYTITQKDSSTAISGDIIIKGGDHNITFKDVNIDSESRFAVLNSSAKIIGEGTNKLGSILAYGTVEIDDGTFEITAKDKAINIIEGSFTVNSGNITANGMESSGIYNNGNFEIKGGTVTAHLDNAGEIDGGVYNKGTFIVSGGELRSTSEVDGGLINDGTMKITGGKVYIACEGLHNNGLFIGALDSVGKFEVLGGSVEVYPDIVIASGEAVITGGSFKIDEISSDPVINTYGDELECVVYDTYPDESERTFENSDGSSYVYALEETDAAPDGKYYVWKPKDKSLEITAENFPDEKFMSYVSTKFDKDNDGKLSGIEMAAVTTIDVSDGDSLIDPGITSLNGIEHFENLSILDCSRNYGLTSLNLSSNTALETLHCDSTGITSLDLSSNTALKKLYCQNTHITSLDVSSNTVLETLFCNITDITSINVSSNTALKDLYCNNTGITSLDVSDNTALKTLYCSNTDITSLDVSDNTALTDLNCDNTDISSLDVSSNTALKKLYCSDTQITELDVSRNTALEHLECSNTQITDLDVSSKTALTYLDCSNTKITSFDVSSNTALTYLDCSDTQITRLDVSSNTALKKLYCSNCNLAYIDVSNNPGITTFSASSNTYSISLDPSGQFNVNNIPDIDPNKISGVNGADYDSASGIFSNFAGDTVTYTYDCGNGYSETFTLKTTGRIMLDKSQYVEDMSDRLVIIPGVNDGTEDPDKNVTGDYHDNRVPDENKLVIIPGVNDGTEESAETAVPEDEEITVPEGEETAAPDEAGTAVPEGEETASPEIEETVGVESVSPDGSETAVPESVETAAPEVLMSAVADVLTAVVRSEVMIFVIMKFLVTAFLAIPIKLILIIFGGK